MTFSDPYRTIIVEPVEVPAEPARTPAPEEKPAREQRPEAPEAVPEPAEAQVLTLGLDP